MPRGPGAPTAILIKNHLLKVGEDYPNSVWRAVRDEVEELSKGRREPYRPPTYTGIRIMLLALRKLGLITLSRKEPIPGAGKPDKLSSKRFYRITPGKEDDPGWESPIEALYYPDRFSKRPSRGRSLKQLKQLS